MAKDIQAVPSAAAQTSGGGHATGRLGAFLCWAVVFADIGTSVYYTPGILYGQVKGLAGLFVTMTMIVFVLLTLKYAEVSVRFPEGGGVVTVSARGLNPWAGAVGGMFILVDYFLTSAISSLSGLQYFASAFFPRTSAALVLLITVVVLVLLGLLNWWGIKESATVSAVFAVAAFTLDAVILIAVFGSLPLSTIVHDFGKMFTGAPITAGTLVTGYAGAFLAFSGLESISQLSPVMRTPRRKTVSLALALVAITVGITSPLLTFFSTTALTNVSQVDPNTFISALALQFGGRGIEVLTALTASTLLIFASNTAIIGAYHVFLALSRMQFFPEVVERHNKFRGTPHVAIILATGIPILVLLAVSGRIDLLGDMYAFGLLGAFSLTSVALDVIRWRERHNHVVVWHPDEDETGAPTTVSGGQLAVLRARLAARMGPEARVRLRQVADGGRVALAWLARTTHGARLALRLAWPAVRYYLGFVTTLLVVFAWCVNLINKPLATEFGGALTVLGVTISVVHYRWRQRAGEKPIFPMAFLRPVPQSRLVVLARDAAHNQAVIRAALAAADAHGLVFLYLGAPAEPVSQPLAINDPYFRDTQAKRTFSQAAAAAAQASIPAYFIYRTGGPASVADVWRIVRPSEIIAEMSVAKTLSRQVPPDYVRYQPVDGVQVAHFVRHHVTSLDEPAVEGGAAAPQPRQRAAAPEAAPSAPGTPSAPAPPGAAGKRDVLSGIKRVTGTPSGERRGLSPAGGPPRVPRPNGKPAGAVTPRPATAPTPLPPDEEPRAAAPESAPQPQTEPSPPAEPDAGRGQGEGEGEGEAS